MYGKIVPPKAARLTRRHFSVVAGKPGPLGNGLADSAVVAAPSRSAGPSESVCIARARRGVGMRHGATPKDLMIWCAEFQSMALSHKHVHALWDPDACVAVFCSCREKLGKQTRRFSVRRRLGVCVGGVGR